MNELLRQHATTVVSRLKAGEITPFDCLDALEVAHRGGRSEGECTADAVLRSGAGGSDGAHEEAGGERGTLCGLPLPIKDLNDVKGVRSTQGSPIYADRIAEDSDILVEHLEREGGIVYAMSNTPEFGAGANTFNEVFGRTLNPWNRTRSAAGSSGGAAVALATGMAWVAHGSDMGGSLRNPASFCGVVGMRPSPGRVAVSVFSKIDGTLGLDGPMARNVEDLACCSMRWSAPSLAIPCHCRRRMSPISRRRRAGEAETRGGEPRSRHHAGRSGSRRSCYEGGEAARGRRRHRRRGASRFQRST